MSDERGDGTAASPRTAHGVHFRAHDGHPAALAEQVSAGLTASNEQAAPLHEVRLFSCSASAHGYVSAYVNTNYPHGIVKHHMVKVLAP